MFLECYYPESTYINSKYIEYLQVHKDVNLEEGFYYVFAYIHAYDDDNEDGRYRLSVGYKDKKEAEKCMNRLIIYMEQD